MKIALAHQRRETRGYHCSVAKTRWMAATLTRPGRRRGDARSTTLEIRLHDLASRSPSIGCWHVSPLRRQELRTLKLRLAHDQARLKTLWDHTPRRIDDELDEIPRIANGIYRDDVQRGVGDQAGLMLHLVFAPSGPTASARRMLGVDDWCDEHCGKER